jgi:hypothetical protein
LPAALLDCGAEMPRSDLAAAAVVFTQLARMHIEGLAGPQRVGQKTEEVLIRCGYAKSIIALPLGRLYYIADEWDVGWGRANGEPARIVRDACEDRLRARTQVDQLRRGFRRFCHAARGGNRSAG